MMLVNILRNYFSWTLRTAIVVCCSLTCLQPWSAGAQGTNSAAKKKQATSESGVSGKQTFETVCAACHGLDGQGGERGPNIATRPEVRKLSDRELLRILRDGKTASGMPAFGGLGETRLASVLLHLRGLQGKGSLATLPGNSAAGKELFYGTAGCSSCHMIRGAGGFIGGDLSAYGANVAPKDIREAILSPNKEGDPRRRAVAVTSQDGQTFTGIMRNEDNFSLQLQTMDGAFHLFSKAALKSVTIQSESIMPADYESKLSSKNMDDLIHYLVSAANEGKGTNGKEHGEDEHEDDE